MIELIFIKLRKSVCKHLDIILLENCRIVQLIISRHQYLEYLPYSVFHFAKVRFQLIESYGIINYQNGKPDKGIFTNSNIITFRLVLHDPCSDLLGLPSFLIQNHTERIGNTRAPPGKLMHKPNGCNGAEKLGKLSKIHSDLIFMAFANC